MKLIEIQLGKHGITENFISTLKDHFKKHRQVRVSVLKSAGHDRESIKKYVGELQSYLGSNYIAKKIGFKIILWKKGKR